MQGNNNFKIAPESCDTRTPVAPTTESLSTALPLPIPPLCNQIKIKKKVKLSEKCIDLQLQSTDRKSETRKKKHETRKDAPICGGLQDGVEIDGVGRIAASAGRQRKDSKSEEEEEEEREKKKHGEGESGSRRSSRREESRVTSGFRHRRRRRREPKKP